MNDGWLDSDKDRQLDVLIIGAGQAGLGAGYWLARRFGANFLIVDAAGELGQSWRERWDSLTLFTPRRFTALPGLRFPPGRGRYPDKEEMVSYLTRYARIHELPVRLDTTVERLSAPANGGRGFSAQTNHGLIHARQVVVATGPFHRPALPPAADSLPATVRQLHSAHYRRPSDLPVGDVLVVGGGNSAAQLACELASTHRVTIASGRRPWYLPTHILGMNLYRWLYLTTVLNADASSLVARTVQRRSEAIIGRDLQGLVASGQVRLLATRVTASAGGDLLLADGGRISPKSVLWCTGFRPAYDWLEIPGALDSDGAPLHTRGASPVSGLHWMGLPWQTRLNSSLVDGVDRDARALLSRLHASGQLPGPHRSDRRNRTAPADTAP